MFFILTERHYNPNTKLIKCVIVNCGTDGTYVNNIHKCFNDIEFKTHEKQKTDYEHKQAKN